ncbi:MAG TPA: RNase III inhibitor [Planctomycetaceae bacterium]|nr:RNase III inhibitor [Planctomycetaceae bacterium]
MKQRIGNCILELAIGDITAEQTDAIVNAANSELAGGGGVDGAIHAAAGPSIMQQTRKQFPEGCPTGSAVATNGGQLNVKYIFHTVGPIWRGGRLPEEADLRSAYRSCLQLAIDFKCESLSFPAISTGVYGYPLDLATEASLDEIKIFLINNEAPKRIRCVLFNEGIYGAYARVLESWS